MRVFRRLRLSALLAMSSVAYIAHEGAQTAFANTKKTVVLLAAGVVAVLAPGAVLVVSLAGAFGTRRVSGAGVDVSVADAVLLLSVLASIPLVRQLTPRLTRLLWADAVFQLLLLIVVIANPTERAAFEWLHRILLVSGALLVGAALRATGLYTRAFRVYVIVAAVVSIDAVRRAVMTGFAPAYPLGIQKNPAALLIGFALLVLLAAPNTLRTSAATLRIASGLLLLGMAATRSRGSILALLVVGFVVLVRSGRIHRVLPAAIVSAAVMGAVVVSTTDAELTLNREDPSAARFHGIGARRETTEIALEIARQQPVVGAGLRYWYDPAVSAAHPGATVEPHSVALVTVAEGGAIGAVAILLLLVGAATALRESRGDVVTLAGAGLWMRVLAGLFDVYWVGGTGSLPWILVGVALSAGERSAGAEDATDGTVVAGLSLP